MSDDRQVTRPATEDEDAELRPEELESENAQELPEREEMSLINPWGPPVEATGGM